ncbi:hypothetical protein DdX_09680 [Ditylenchus destructor]|uniref:Uncharacterized protein n=1 Tax=Ditylenchus destructor TaxID=166010 RepID=A0AAD4R2T9_9BILA|nr:hypothetical protein DdX_09680 [Ditylenchus destructor]
MTKRQLGQCLFCGCVSNQAPNENSHSTAIQTQQDDEPYGTIPTSTSPYESSKEATKIVWCFNLRRNKADKALAKSGTVRNQIQNEARKKVPFSWRTRRKSSDIGPAYDYIDADSDGMDPVYSRVDENPTSNQRYDYPTFSTKERSRKQNIAEPLYTSASQIYSGGSEDPYSSIISEGKGRGGAYEESIYDTAGYARVNDPATRRSGHNVKDNIDALYAKINRSGNTSRRRSPQPSTSAACRPADSQAPNRTNTVPVRLRHTGTLPKLPTQVYPSTLATSENAYHVGDGESGSGSIVSGGSSQNPSYRYLTVRESVDVVRERLRLREQERANTSGNTESGDLFPIREHYYSTITNEYESVGGDSTANSLYGSVHAASANNTLSNRFPSSSINTLPGELSVNVSRFDHSSASNQTSAVPPKPPTSPIPNRIMPGDITISSKPSSNVHILRPIVLSPATDSLPTSRPPTSNETSFRRGDQLSSSLQSRPALQEFTNTFIPSCKTSSNPNLGRPPAVPGTNPPPIHNGPNRNSFPYDPRSAIKHGFQEQSPSFSNHAVASADRNSYTHRFLPTSPYANAVGAATTQTTISNGVGKAHKTKPDTAEIPTQTQLSKIPVPVGQSQSIANLRSRTPSPTVEVGTQTARKHTKKKVLDPLPSPVGKDYVSPVDLGRERAWPLWPSIATNNKDKDEENKTE